MKKILKIISNQGNANQNYTVIPFTPVRTAIAMMWRKRNTFILLVGM
jgi:hypothetical protein